MKKTMIRSMFVAVLAASAGCASSGDCAPPPPKPITVVHNEPQKPAQPVIAEPVAPRPAPPIEMARPKPKVTIVDENPPAPTSPVRKVALVVQNHASPTRPVPMAALADSLTVSLSRCGFQVVNPSNVFGVDQNRAAVGEVMPPASALNLARQVGADGVVTASVMDFFDTAVVPDGSLRKFSVSLALNLADCASCAVVCSAKVKAESPNKPAEYIKNNGVALYEELLHSAADACADQLLRNVASTGWNPGRADEVTVFFGCNVLGADIQIDGLSYGTCPAQVSIPKGPHNILVSYLGNRHYYNFNRRAMFNAEGQTFAVVLERTPEGEKVRRSGELFDKQKTLFDAELERYKKSGEVEDYVRKTIADGVSIYWKNSYGRIIVTDAKAENIEFTTPATDAADLQNAPNTSQGAKKLKELLMETEKLNAVPAAPAAVPAKSAPPAS